MMGRFMGWLEVTGPWHVEVIAQARRNLKLPHGSGWTPYSGTGATAMISLLLPHLVRAQASPFLTGATALQSNILAWLTPIAVILVMALGAMAMANRLSWGWCIGAILGIAIAFGAPQIVSWVRTMFGV